MLNASNITNFTQAVELSFKLYEDNLKKYPSMKDDKNDLRVTIFGQLSNVLHSYAVAIELAQTKFKEVDFWEEKKLLTPEDITKFKREFEVCMYKGYYLIFYSRLEWSLRNILLHVKPGACNDGLGDFKNIYECLFKEIETKHLSSVFDLGRHLRNLVHNNGYYCDKQKKASLPIVYNENTYSFDHGKLIEVTDLSFQIMKDLVKASEEIVNTLKVSSFDNMFETIPVN
ncbi:MAG: hypothetical protein NTU81_03030 [Candidatus Nomurabacteria bacterium]|nr:hypothetical protein [Candidatus Nomurabacteria bacterium]